MYVQKLFNGRLVSGVAWPDLAAKIIIMVLYHIYIHYITYNASHGKKIGYVYITVVLFPYICV